MQAVTAIRNIRGEMRISPGPDARRHREGRRPATARCCASTRALIETLARGARSPSTPRRRGRAPPPSASSASSEIYVDLEGLVDLAAERQRLEKEIKRTDRGIAFTRGKLARPDFTERAPAEIVDKEREKLAEQEALQRQARGQPGLGGMTAARPRRPIVRLGRVDSTQTVAFALAAEGAADGTVVIGRLAGGRPRAPRPRLAGRARREPARLDRPASAPRASRALAGLSLAAAVAVAEALTRDGRA